MNIEIGKAPKKTRADRDERYDEYIDVVMDNPGEWVAMDIGLENRANAYSKAARELARRHADITTTMHAEHATLYMRLNNG